MNWKMYCFRRCRQEAEWYKVLYTTEWWCQITWSNIIQKCSNEKSGSFRKVRKSIEIIFSLQLLDWAMNQKHWQFSTPINPNNVYWSLFLFSFPHISVWCALQQLNTNPFRYFTQKPPVKLPMHPSNYPRDLSFTNVAFHLISDNDTDFN